MSLAARAVAAHNTKTCVARFERSFMVASLGSPAAALRLPAARVLGAAP